MGVELYEVQLFAAYGEQGGGPAGGNRGWTWAGGDGGCGCAQYGEFGGDGSCAALSAQFLFVGGAAGAGVEGLCARDARAG